MLGAIIGDMVGSVYEFNNTKRTDFPFFTPQSIFTDDSIMTIAVADWLLSDETLSHAVLESKMARYASAFPNLMGGYGGNFSKWLFGPGPRRPYGSWATVPQCECRQSVGCIIHSSRPLMLQKSQHPSPTTIRRASRAHRQQTIG